MTKVTTTSDNELVVIKLTEAGAEKFEQGLPLAMEDIITPVGGYTKVRAKVNEYVGVTYDAVYDDTEGRASATNCYLSTYDLNIADGKGKATLKSVPCVIMTIPSGTFCEDGWLYVAITAQTANEHFEDLKEDTESVFEKTEVYYVLQ